MQSVGQINFGINDSKLSEIIPESCNIILEKLEMLDNIEKLCTTIDNKVHGLYKSVSECNNKASRYPIINILDEEVRPLMKCVSI